MRKLTIRASAMKLFMTKSRSKADPLSETTKSYLMKLAKEDIFDYREEITSKQMTKGTDCEQQSIDLLNSVRFEGYQKNDERFLMYDDKLSGEPDIITEETIIDVKTSWSLATFPAFNYEAEKVVKTSGYDYQLQAYMLLTNTPKAEIVFCMIDTPPELLSEWDDFNVHRVEHIDPKLRITTVAVERDYDFGEKFLAQYELANEFYINLFNQ